MVPHKFPQISMGILPAEAQQQPAFEIVFQTFPFITPTAIIAEARSPSFPSNEGRKLLHVSGSQIPHPRGAASPVLPAIPIAREERKKIKQLEERQILPEIAPSKDHTEHLFPSFLRIQLHGLSWLDSDNSPQYQQSTALCAELVRRNKSRF